MTASAAFVVAAAAVAAVSLAVQRLRLGRIAPPLAPAKGRAAAGVAYAFTVAFAPWAKESARRHLPTYTAGIVYHAAILAMLARLLSSPFVPALPRSGGTAVAGLLAAGLACGFALLAKRAADPALRGLSVPDDFLANVLVDLALATGAAGVLTPAWLAASQLAGGALLLYAPLGKLRHMLILLTSRRLTGANFGRRGVRPYPSGAARG